MTNSKDIQQRVQAHTSISRSNSDYSDDSGSDNEYYRPDNFALGNVAMAKLGISPNKVRQPSRVSADFDDDYASDASTKSTSGAKSKKGGFFSFNRDDKGGEKKSDKKDKRKSKKSAQSDDRHQYEALRSETSKQQYDKLRFDDDSDSKKSKSKQKQESPKFTRKQQKQQKESPKGARRRHSDEYEDDSVTARLRLLPSYSVEDSVAANMEQVHLAEDYNAISFQMIAGLSLLSVLRDQILLLSDSVLQEGASDLDKYTSEDVLSIAEHLILAKELIGFLRTIPDTVLKIVHSYNEETLSNIATSVRVEGANACYKTLEDMIICSDINTCAPLMASLDAAFNIAMVHNGIKVGNKDNVTVGRTNKETLKAMRKLLNRDPLDKPQLRAFVDTLVKLQTNSGASAAGIVNEVLKRHKQITESIERKFGLDAEAKELASNATINYLSPFGKRSGRYLFSALAYQTSTLINLSSCTDAFVVLAQLCGTDSNGYAKIPKDLAKLIVSRNEKLETKEAKRVAKFQKYSESSKKHSSKK